MALLHNRSDLVETDVHPAVEQAALDVEEEYEAKLESFQTHWTRLTTLRDQIRLFRLHGIDGKADDDDDGAKKMPRRFRRCKIQQGSAEEDAYVLQSLVAAVPSADDLGHVRRVMQVLLYFGHVQQVTSIQRTIQRCLTHMAAHPLPPPVHEADIPIMKNDDPMPAEWAHHLTFALNGRKVVVDGNTLPRFNDLRLIDYIRDHAGLTGTKLACGEGGCGACTVVLCHRVSPSSPLVHRSVNACLIPLASIDGMAVLTVEGVGSTKHRLHPIQSKMVDNYSMQCGYCTPGWVMNMYELLHTSDPSSLTKDTIENHFDGNLCRCTGYRPILKAMNSFGIDGPAPQLEYESSYDGVPFVDVDEP
ncbi:hypothetical protein DYB30_012369, partial [Aphanomyces astaci]